MKVRREGGEEDKFELLSVNRKNFTFSSQSLSRVKFLRENPSCFGIFSFSIFFFLVPIFGWWTHSAVDPNLLLPHRDSGGEARTLLTAQQSLTGQEKTAVGKPVNLTEPNCAPPDSR